MLVMVALGARCTPLMACGDLRCEVLWCGGATDDDEWHAPCHAGRPHPFPFALSLSKGASFAAAPSRAFRQAGREWRRSTVVVIRHGVGWQRFGACPSTSSGRTVEGRGDGAWQHGGMIGRGDGWQRYGTRPSTDSGRTVEGHGGGERWWARWCGPMAGHGGGEQAVSCPDTTRAAGAGSGRSSAGCRPAGP